MAVIKVKPTSPGRRAVVKSRIRTCTRAGPKRRCSSRRCRTPAATTTATSRSATRAVATSTTTAWSTSCATRTAFRPRSSASSTTRTAAPTSRWSCYADGERRYVIAPRGLEVGATLLSGAEAPIKAGNTLPIRNIPVGSIVHCVEMLPGKGAQIARSAGTAVHAAGARRHLRAGAAALGRSAQDPHRLPRDDRRSRRTKSTACASYGKAGVKRWMGIRPTVRGVAMNPVDHPHGGGEGRTGEGQAPCRRGTR